MTGQSSNFFPYAGGFGYAQNSHHCCRNGSLPAAAESCKKGTLKLDLQSLTVGVAVVSMGAWLLSARAALLQDTPTSLDAARKLAVVNGLGEHSRAQVRGFALMSAPLRAM